MDVRELLELVENTMPMSEQMTEFVDGYIVAMLWANTLDGETSEMVDATDRAGELTVTALARMVEDAHAFLFADLPDDFQSEAVENVFDLIDTLPYPESMHGASPCSLAGHDFALTRNRHGAGFWDRGLGEAGDILTDLAHSFGEATLYASAYAEAITHA